jgi:hypothetical protein
LLGMQDEGVGTKYPKAIESRTREYGTKVIIGGGERGQRQWKTNCNCSQVSHQ